jgi:hypothetical protein
MHAVQLTELMHDVPIAILGDRNLVKGHVFGSKDTHDYGELIKFKLEH